jgi:hypothetical protein
MLAAASPALAQYAGPAILARGQSPGAMAPTQIDFRPYLSVTGTYDEGLNGVSVDPTGAPVNDAAYGVSVNFGISGNHAWRHTRLGVNFATGFSHYSRQFYDGINAQTFQISLFQQLTRHAALNFSNTAVLYGSNRSTPALPNTIDFDPSTTYIPTNDFFDNRTFSVSSTLGFTLQKSSRLSFSFAGDGFLTRRRSSALYGSKGIGGQGDVMYRLGRRTTVGAMYSYIHYKFTGVAGGTDLHSINAVYSRTLTRNTQFSAFGGITHYENLLVQTVAIDPAVAAVIGISSAQRISYTVSTVPTGGGRLSWNVPRGVFFANASSSVTPGNGLFLTSTMVNVGVGYSYTGLRRWALSAGANYDRSTSLANVYGDYGGYSANLSASRQVAPFTHGVVSFVARRYSSGDFHNYNKWAVSANLGLTFSPGDIPVRLW